MLLDRPDLDGLRLQQHGETETWLMYHGRRHRIASVSAQECLFGSNRSALEVNDIEAISLGPDLAEGTCLIQSDSKGDIYLLSGTEQSARLNRILSWESFVEFDFCLQAVRTVPDLLIGVIKPGRALTGANDRARRTG